MQKARTILWLAFDSCSIFDWAGPFDLSWSIVHYFLTMEKKRSFRICMLFDFLSILTYFHNKHLKKRRKGKAVLVFEEYTRWNKLNLDSWAKASLGNPITRKYVFRLLLEQKRALMVENEQKSLISLLQIEIHAFGIFVDFWLFFKISLGNTLFNAKRPIVIFKHCDILLAFS